jgi:dipeptidase
MPNPIGGLLWAGIGEGATCGHVPYYSGITKTPKAYNIGSQNAYPWEPFVDGSIYNENSAYWRFRELSNLVNLFYDATKEMVIPIWRNWEEKLYNLQNKIEEVALLLYKQNPKLANDFLTSYSNSKAIEAFEMTKNMIKRLHTIIAHYNGPL